jgi:hypothetical protein
VYDGGFVRVLGDMGEVMWGFTPPYMTSDGEGSAFVPGEKAAKSLKMIDSPTGRL